MRLILASGSPRRAALLVAAAVPFEVRAVSVDEAVRAGEPPAKYVERLAADKARRGWDLVAGGGELAEELVVLGADTAVVVDDRVLGKPRDAAEARLMIEQLSGRAHLVLTGVCLRAAGREERGVARTVVWFRQLEPDEVVWYVGTGEGRDKAGAYAIQGLASRFVPRIDGSYTNVVGLPVALVVELLRKMERIDT
jgi:septum formation protein